MTEFLVLELLAEKRASDGAALRIPPDPWR